MNRNLKDIKIILIHGNGGPGKDEHWFPYIERELGKLGLKVIRENFPDAELAREIYWIPFLEKDLKADENTIIIGHSSGAVAAMRYAENHKIFGSILVGCNYTDLGYESEAASGYYSRPWIWDKIKENQEFIIQFASLDDTFIPIEEPRFIHKNLESEYHEYENEGHFGYDARTKLEFPEIVEIIKKKLEI